MSSNFSSGLISSTFFGSSSQFSVHSSLSLLGAGGLKPAPGLGSWLGTAGVFVGGDVGVLGTLGRVVYINCSGL